MNQVARALEDLLRVTSDRVVIGMDPHKRCATIEVYRRMIDDAAAATAAGPGGQRGTTTDSSVTNSHPHAGSSEKSLPGPAETQLRTPLSAGDDTEGSLLRVAPPVSGEAG
jgi:transposase